MSKKWYIKGPVESGIWQKIKNAPGNTIPAAQYLVGLYTHLDKNSTSVYIFQGGVHDR